MVQSLAITYSCDSQGQRAFFLRASWQQKNHRGLYPAEGNFRDSEFYGSALATCGRLTSESSPASLRTTAGSCLNFVLLPFCNDPAAEGAQSEASICVAKLTAALIPNSTHAFSYVRVADTCGCHRIGPFGFPSYPAISC